MSTAGIFQTLTCIRLHSNKIDDICMQYTYKYYIIYICSYLCSDIKQSTRTETHSRKNFVDRKTCLIPRGYIYTCL